MGEHKLSDFERYFLCIEFPMNEEYLCDEEYLTVMKPIRPKVV